MKKLMLMLLIGICTIGWRTPEIMQVLGLSDAADVTKPSTVLGAGPVSRTQPAPMSAVEVIELSKTDPLAYQKFINSYVEQPAERGEVDKLMNFLARGAYE